MANRGRQPNRPEIQVRRFKLDEVEAGIKKLKRRIEQVKALDPTTVRYDDERRYAAERDIRSDIIEIFSQNSPEYLANGHPEIWEGSHNLNMHPSECQERFARGIPRMVVMLEGLVVRLEEKRADLAGADPGSRARAAFEGLNLHPRIAGVCAELYRNGHYRNAVLDSVIAVVNFVKEKSRRHDLDGAALMRAVFSRNGPVLAFNELKDQTDGDEQEGMMHLFEGAVLALRNPRAHALFDDSPEHALECIGLLNFLAWQIDRSWRRNA